MEQSEGPATQEHQQPQQRGGVLYITDPPPTLDFGIDCMHYETGAKFRGVSMVPKGLHFVYHSTGMGSRQGFFLYFEKDAIVVKSWDTKNEDISAQLLLPEAALQSLLYSINSGQEDHYLGPYPLQQHSSWVNLSNFMTVSTLQRAGLDFHTPIYPGDAEDIPVELLSEQNKQAVTSYFPDQARVAQFCDIKLLELNLRKTVTSSTSLDASAKALELSQLYLDNSTLLENVVSQYFDSSWEELLAEVQLSFMLFMLIFSFPALQQWKALVNLICKSERVLLSQPNFTSCFIRLFYEQLQYSPGI
jgi:A1 cistron-splicing factor AAR2